jgi:large subunit ribosomal protein LX
MSKVKVYRVRGRINKPNYLSPFVKELRATSVEGAVERIYADLGSRHRVKRCHIKIEAVEEIRPEDSKDELVKQLSRM